MALAERLFAGIRNVVSHTVAETEADEQRALEQLAAGHRDPRHHARLRPHLRQPDPQRHPHRRLRPRGRRGLSSCKRGWAAHEVPASLLR